ncbi:MAG: sulfatase, partial [Planctomycetota bacterium]
MDPLNRYERSRRAFLARAGNGFFGTAMTYMLAGDGSLRAAPGTNAGPTLPAKAKACIFLFMVGGPS